MSAAAGGGTMCHVTLWRPASVLSSASRQPGHRTGNFPAALPAARAVAAARAVLLLLLCHFLHTRPSFHVRLESDLSADVVIGRCLG